MTLETRLKKASKGLVAQSTNSMADDSFLSAAQDAGLVDIAYAEFDSPNGQWLIAATPRGLVKLSFTDYVDGTLEELAKKISPRIMRAPAKLDDVRRELDEYFEGERQEFDVPLDWQLVKGFNLKVLRACAAIPFGSVSSYSDLARKAGSPRAARAAGNALHNNPLPIVVPCHRVLHRDGGLGGYGGGLPLKERLLTLEGALERP